MKKIQEGMRAYSRPYYNAFSNAFNSQTRHESSFQKRVHANFQDQVTTDMEKIGCTHRTSLRDTQYGVTIDKR